MYVWGRAALVLFAMLMPLHLPFFVAPAMDASTVPGLWAEPRGGTGNERVVTRVMWPVSLSGLLPGDVIVGIDEAPENADGAAIDAADTGQAVIVRYRRGGIEQTAVVPTSASTFSYVAYRWYRVGLAVCAWLVGLGIVAVRGGSADALLLGGLLILLGPITVPVAIPDRGPALAVANYLWQMAGAGYRFMLPLLGLLFLLRHSSRHWLVESPRTQVVLVVSCLIALAAITNGLRSPLEWSAPGMRQDLRAVTGLAVEVLALAGVVWVRRDLLGTSGPLRWLCFAIVLVLASGTLLSVAMVSGVSGGTLADTLRQVKALTLAPLPVAVMLYFLLGHGDAGEIWQLRRHASAFVYALLLGLYGFAVAGAAAIALNAMGRSLGGAETSLFAAIFFATIVFSPVLKWAREIIDRRVFARWMAMEQRAHALVDTLNSTLELHTLAPRLQLSLPQTVDVHAVRLIVVEELTEGWHVPEHEALAMEPRGVLADRIAAVQPGAAVCLEPVLRPSGHLLGAIEYQLPDFRSQLTPPELSALKAVAQGAAVALRNAESHVALERATRDAAEGDRIAALGAMACGLAHEIKNPLASLKLGVYLLGKEHSNSERIHRIERDVRRIDDLVSSLSRFTRASDREPPTPIDVRPVVGAAVDDLLPLAHDRDVRVTQAYPREALVILGGASEIRVLVSNLLRNSLDASDAGGHVTVSVAAEGRDVLIEIHDEGPGIPTEMHRQVFELDYSTKAEGGGLGLALARREAEWLGGRIELESTPGHGTTLRVRLPRTTAAEESA